MGMLNEKVPVSISRRNRKYYVDKGYNIPDNFEGIFDIYCKDVNPKSKTNIIFICDCCGTKFERSAQNHYRRFAKAIDSNVYCPNCYHKHTIESMKEKYGVEYGTQIEGYKEKSKETFKKRYGVDHPLQSKRIQEKIKQTCLEKYGVNSYTKTEKFREQAKKLFNNNNLVSCSKAQKHICELFECKLNYHFHGFYLDCLYQDWLDIEYDGSGHNLSVKTGKITQEDFDLKQRQRYAVLHQFGIKTITILGNKQDILPIDSILQADIEKAIQYLKETKANSYTIDYSNL